MTKILVTGASGQLGQRVIDHLIARGAAADVIALVRTDAQAEGFAAKSIATRKGDYEDVASLKAAFEGVEKLLLISSPAVGQRAAQHQNVIDAAKAAGVGFIAYTSLLKAANSPLGLAAEHKVTEEALAASGLPHAVLRNGWYSENIAGTAPKAVQMGQHFGAAGEGKFSTATRNDYAEAAAVVLTTEGHAGKTYELAGDTGFTLGEYAALVGATTGAAIGYTNLDEDSYKQALIKAGLPDGFAALLADSDTGASNGYLFEDGGDLSKLIGRPTTPMADTLKDVLAA